MKPAMRRVLLICLLLCAAFNGATSAKTNVCLVMIMKDEEANFAKLLPSVKDHITGWTACDTGSTDNTVQHLEQFFKQNNIPGTVVHHNWKNFAHNRNLCIDAAKQWSKSQPKPCQYWLLMDADMDLLHDNDTKVPPLKDQTLNADSYRIREYSAVRYLDHPRLVKASLDWQYLGAVHEYLRRVDAEHDPGDLLPGLYMNHYASYDRSSETDADLLEEALIDDPNDARAHFYLANTYKSMKKYELAMKHYMTRIQLGGWEEERFVAAFNAADMILTMVEEGLKVDDSFTGLTTWLGNTNDESCSPWHHVINAYSAASTLLPYRQEPLIRMASIYRISFNDYEGCFSYAAMAYALGPHKDNSLMPIVDLYTFGALDEMCVCGWYTDNVQKGYDACRELEIKLREHLPTSRDEELLTRRLDRTVKNQIHYQQKLAKSTF